MNGRVYDYNLGRFLSVDPLIHMEGGSQGINPYSYIMNNPLAGTDPTGYDPEIEKVEITDVKTEKVAVTGSRIKRDQVTQVSGTVTLSNGSQQSFTADYSGGSLSGLSTTEIGGQNSIAKNDNTGGGIVDSIKGGVGYVMNGFKTDQEYMNDLKSDYDEKKNKIEAAFGTCEERGECLSSEVIELQSEVPNILGAAAPGPLIASKAMSGYKTTKATANLRGAYLSQVDDLAGAASSIRAAGLNAEQTARILVPLRNSLKMEIRAQGSWIASKVAGLRNQFKYGNRAGPSADELYRKHGSWEGVLDSLGKTNATVNRATGN